MLALDQTHATSAGTVRAGIVGDGPDLVLAHGWPWSSFSWHRVAPRLAERYRVHFYDMPGFGQSEMDGPRPASLDTQGEVFGEMLDHWGLERPLVVAHDFGGAVTLRAHLLHGRDYAGWVLMNVVAMRPWGSEFFDHVGRHVEAFEGLPRHIHEAVVKAYIGGAVVHEIAPEDKEQLAAPWLTDVGKRAFYAQFALADEGFTAEVEPLFGEARCAVAILWGEDDPWIPVERGHALAERMGVELSPMPGLGHLPQLENPPFVAGRLIAALDEIA